MFPRTNIKHQLVKSRNNRISSKELMEEVQALLAQNERDRQQIISRLSRKSSKEYVSLNLSLLETERIFHLDDIKKICINYRLRFLDSHFFKGKFPEEAVSEIRQLEKEQGQKLTDFKIVAPSKLLKLENADDPLLFTPIGNDYFYLIHSWGNDLHPFRKALMWPYKNFENLVFTIFLLSVFLTSITPIGRFSHTTGTQEYLLLFLFVFKGVAGVVLFYGFAKGKNFNHAIWRSKYYNA